MRRNPFLRVALETSENTEEVISDLLNALPNKDNKYRYIKIFYLLIYLFTY